MKIVFFEDPLYRDFDPLSLSHPVYMLLWGTGRIYMKWLKALGPEDYSFLCRPFLAQQLSNETGKQANNIPEDDFVFLNGRFIPDKESLAAIRNLSAGEALAMEDALVCFRPAPGWYIPHHEIFANLYDSSAYGKARSSFKEKKIKTKQVKYLWEMINQNSEMIEKEFALFARKGRLSGKIAPKAIIIKKSRVVVSGRATVGPQVVIDASDGAVIIDAGAVIEPFSYIKGPSYIGTNCRVVSGRIGGGCSFGQVCRIGGEVEESIMLGYCNKYHEGFLGHSYLGEWVNLGAMTTNSDLKNNYTRIKASVGDRVLDTGQIKVGCFIGDHTKTGIGTLLNTGISIGFSCNLYGGGLFSDRMIRSFSWGTPGRLVEYEIEKALQTASNSMRRRDIALGQGHERIFSEVHRQSGWHFEKMA